MKYVLSIAVFICSFLAISFVAWLPVNVFAALFGLSGMLIYTIWIILAAMFAFMITSLVYKKLFRKNEINNTLVTNIQTSQQNIPQQQNTIPTAPIQSVTPPVTQSETTTPPPVVS